MQAAKKMTNSLLPLSFNSLREQEEISREKLDFMVQWLKRVGSQKTAASENELPKNFTTSDSCS